MHEEMLFCCTDMERQVKKRDMYSRCTLSCLILREKISNKIILLKRETDPYNLKESRGKMGKSRVTFKVETDECIGGNIVQ